MQFGFPKHEAQLIVFQLLVLILSFGCPNVLKYKTLNNFLNVIYIRIILFSVP